MRRLLELFVLAVVLLAGPGCPDDVTAPVPDGGQPCATRADCNDGRTCGELRECVAMRCTASATVVVPCR
ncbi:MAG: hypothetical protein IT379_10565 [Deltaproteobacteria bacterium]|nr:hypothetical protein [Deltaproteobacteria bacterium]